MRVDAGIDHRGGAHVCPAAVRVELETGQLSNWLSGEADTNGHISKCGDGLLRAYLFEAATVLLQRHSRASTLKTWGLTLAKRIRIRRARVAVARKLAVIMHRVWSDRSEYRWGDDPIAA